MNVDPYSIGIGEVGAGARIYSLARITEPEEVALGANTSIDDFVFIQGRGGLRIGRNVQICCFASITGGGPTHIGDFVTVSPGARILTGMDIPDGSGLVNATVPAELRSIQRQGLTLADHVYIGANAVIFPGVKVGEGAVIGSQALVNEDVEPWSINVGTPSRAIGERPREEVLERARHLLAAG